MIYKLTYKLFSERSVLIEWPAIIDENILNDVILFKEKIRNNKIKEIVELKHAYNSLLVICGDDYFVFGTFEKKLQKLYTQKGPHVELRLKKWEIPVCYDDVFGIDLGEMALEKNMSKKSIIELHSKTVYTVYFIGFLPGFMYLGGLNRKLHTPRKSTPRSRIVKGAVAIGGKQTGVYPNESPGGWNIIGNSPIEFFNPKNAIPCFANAGDKIIFKPVSIKEYKDIKMLIDAGVYQLESEVIDG